MGSDGFNSQVRRAANIPVTETDYQQKGVVAVLQLSEVTIRVNPLLQIARDISHCALVTTNRTTLWKSQMGATSLCSQTSFTQFIHICQCNQSVVDGIFIVIFSLRRTMWRGRDFCQQDQLLCYQ